jgi:hypothetical protein
MNFKHTCLSCGKEFVSQRPHSKFDSDSCRKAYQRARNLKKEEQEKRFKKSKVVKSPEDVKNFVEKNAKEGKLTSEEQFLVDEGILNKDALLKVNPKIRAKWVRDAYIYKPTYIDPDGKAMGKSRFKPYYLTYGAGTRIK